MTARSLRVVRLREFLRSADGAGLQLPALIHTTSASNLYSVLEERRLRATRCSVFQEDLCYLFVGRPAYKWSTKGEASYWQLPFVLVVDGLGEAPVKRIHPFDTGAFALRHLPEYIILFEMGAYDIGKDPGLAGNLMNVFFGSVENYVDARVRSEEEIRTAYGLGARHQEIEALARLYADRSNQGPDDRARTIELQVEEDVQISPDNLLGVVVPKQYTDDAEVGAELKALGCRVETYGEYPLRAENYYGIIYEAVRRITKAGHAK